METMKYVLDAGTFREMPDHIACVLIWEDVDGLRTHVVVNPSAPYGEFPGLESWFNQMLEHVHTLGIAKAVEVDDWQLRSDGAYQKWVRAFDDPFAE